MVTMKVAMLPTALSVILPTQAPAHAPNVVNLLIGDQGTLDAHSYGASDLETPVIDRLATTGAIHTSVRSHGVLSHEGGIVDWTSSAARERQYLDSGKPSRQMREQYESRRTDVG